MINFRWCAIGALSVTSLMLTPDSWGMAGKRKWRGPFQASVRRLPRARRFGQNRHGQVVQDTGPQI